MKYLTLLLAAAALAGGQPRYARLGDFQGQVEVQLRAAEPWIVAERNLPLPESACLRTGPASRVEIELDEGTAWRLGPNSQGEISDYTRLSTGQRITLLSLHKGLAYFTGEAQGRDTLMLAVPGAQITISSSARVRLELQDQWSQVSVMEGAVRFSSPAAELDIREGQTTRVEPANPARFYLYREIGPMDLDAWSEDRDKTLKSSTSAAHVAQRYGRADLDRTGEWIQTEEFGAVWKPKPADGWAPFQHGRWRWYDALGYTWVSDEPWGWLPYHYGRWQRNPDLGWIWVPSQTAVFKPGDVYWLYGPGLAGWGPLGPGESWPAPVPEHPQPQQFLGVNTTFAAFRQDAVLLDPAAFTTRPKEPLAVAAFVPALPSPAFPAAKLDSVRPLRSGRTRVVPVVDGVTFETLSTATVPASPPAPVVVVTQPPPTAQEPQTAAYAVPVAVPVPVLVAAQAAPGAGVPAPAAPARSQRGTVDGRLPAVLRPPVPDPRVPLPETKPRGQMPTKGERPPLPQRGNRTRSEDEAAVYSQVVQSVNARNFDRALAVLDGWSRKYPDSEYASERLYCYMQAYDGLNQPARVVNAGAVYLARGSAAVSDDMLHVAGMLYLTSLNFHKLQSPTPEQVKVADRAAHQLLAVLPRCFDPRNKPAATRLEDWAKTRSTLETMARQTIARVEGR